jgi:hypothetical protein
MIRDTSLVRKKALRQAMDKVRAIPRLTERIHLRADRNIRMMRDRMGIPSSGPEMPVTSAVQLREEEATDLLGQLGKTPWQSGKRERRPGSRSKRRRPKVCPWTMPFPYSRRGTSLPWTDLVELPRELAVTAVDHRLLAIHAQEKIAMEQRLPVGQSMNGEIRTNEATDDKMEHRSISLIMPARRPMSSIQPRGLW